MRRAVNRWMTSSRPGMLRPKMAIKQIILRVAISGGLILTASLTVLVLAARTTPLPAVSSLHPTRLLDRTGRVFAELTPGVSVTPVRLANVPKSFERALIDTEDRTFYSNPGIDPLSLARAAIVDVRSRSVVQGGSTLTQQLAKNLYLSPQRTVTRKLEEIFWTLCLAAHRSKRQVLSQYVNIVFFGEGAYGLGAASQVYFGTAPQYLTLPQAALLAGLVAAPSAYDPYLHPRLALARRRQVLANMAAVGDLSQAAAAQAAAAPLRLSGSPLPPGLDLAPYVTDLVEAELTARAPALALRISRGGYTVLTTLDLPLQQAAQQAILRGLPTVMSSGGVPQPEAAVVGLDPRTGAIRTLLGGRNYTLTPFDRALYGLRQPGSSFKAALYAALLATRRYTASSIIDDAPVAFPGAAKGTAYRPKNASGSYLGPILMRRAIAVSDNVAAVKFAAGLGIPSVVQEARRLGISSPLSANLTLVLGSSPVTPLEMATAYATLANQGRRTTPYVVRAVLDPTGHLVYKTAPTTVQAIDGRVAYILTDLLRSVVRPGGTAANLSGQIPPYAVGKTGTTQSAHDAWMVGYVPTFALAVWVGYDHGQHALSGEGATVAGPIWARILSAYANVHPTGPAPRPSGLVRLAVCSIDGLLPNDTSPTEVNDYLIGTEPQTVSPIRYGGPPSGPVNPGFWYWQGHSKQPTGLPLSP